MIDDLTTKIIELQRQVHDDDARWRRLQARYELHQQLVSNQMALATELYAQCLAAAWYLALNPNLRK